MQGGNEPLLTGGGANHRFARPSGSETYGQPVRPARSASVSADESDPDAPRASAFMSMDDLSGSMEKTEFRLALFLLVGYIIVGGVAFKFVFPIDPASPTTLSNTTFTDALYFTVVTLTTVGYGDLEPQTPGGRVFTAFFLFLGVGFIATCLGIVVGIIMDAEAAEADSVAKAIQGSPDSDEPEPQPSIDDSWGQIRRKLLFSCFNIVVFITIGTVSFAYIEDHDFIDSFYWCCVTSCTVGYGDLAPITVGGRWFAIFYIAVSTVVIAQALGDVSSIPLEIRRQRQEAKVLR
jgi:potassium channel subfamily K